MGKQEADTQAIIAFLRNNVLDGQSMFMTIQYAVHDRLESIINATNSSSHYKYVGLESIQGLLKSAQWIWHQMI